MNTNFNTRLPASSIRYAVTAATKAGCPNAWKAWMDVADARRHWNDAAAESRVMFRAVKYDERPE